MTALENVELPLLLARKPNTEKIARERLRWVGLEGRERSLPHQLSGGQMQRVAVARALVQQPDILIADEPTGNLDTASGGDVLQLLQRAARELGATLLMATHSAEAAAIADVRVYMRDGSVESIQRNL
jgi:ABC-type lipoprotein export system ATPase subunit